MSGEWRLYQEARKTDEARWSQLADQYPERVVQQALELKTAETRIQRLETIIENQRKTNKALSEEVSWYHFGWWSSSRRALKAGEMKLEGYITTLEVAKKIHFTPVDTSPLFDFIVATVPTALVIVASIIVTPMVIKVLFYYLLAPICQRRPPFRIVQTGSTHSGYKFTPSAVSLPFEVEADEEILLKTEFLQSSSQKAKKRTVW